MPLYRSQSSSRRIPPPEPVSLSREILERIERVREYHHVSKHTYEQVQTAQQAGGLDWDNKPSPYRTFTEFPKTPLPTTILDASVPTLDLLSDGLGAVPASQLQPPQNLKTLGTWLYLSNGITIEKGVGARRFSLRSCPSSGALYPFEVYVAAFAVDGLEPGLYHYSVREFALRRLRGGPETLHHLKRGRPDLEFLKTVPAALLVSTNFWRSAWRYRQRAYRYALLDAGHLVQNLVSVAGAIGVQTTVRLRINDKTTRELLGVAEDCDFGEYEPVQAMVVWADAASAPVTFAPRTRPALRSDPEPDPLAGLASSGAFGALPAEAGHTGMSEFPPIARNPLSPSITPYGSIRGAHEDCVAPGVAIREVRPPLTELSPAPVGVEYADLAEPEPLPGGPSLRRVLMTRRTPHDFLRRGISRGQFWTLNRIAFRGGSHHPTYPDGPHAGLVKPFWVLHDVGGLDSGVWYYDSTHDRLGLVRRGDYRMETQYLCLEQQACGNASAVCFMLSDLHSLMSGAGPDAYRLAHLEAGLVAQRVHLAIAAMDLGCGGAGAFYDDEVRRFLDLDRTSWEPIYALAVGVAVPEPAPERPAALQRPPRRW